MIKNLSYTATEKDLREYLEKFGKISNVQLLKKCNGHMTGRGVIEFAHGKGAAEAIQNCSGQQFMGRKIVVDWIAPVLDSKKLKKKCKEKIVVKKEVEETKTEDVKSENDKVEIRSNKSKQQHKKKGRLIVRNLPFKITEEKLIEHFKKFGEITDVSLLRRSDGKLVGCAFIQFTNKNCAAKAIMECSGKPLLGRAIVVDWAVPKSTFKTTDNTQETEIKQEPEETNPSLDDDKTEIVQVKQESSSDEESDVSDTEQLSEDTTKEKVPVTSNDISEGRTVFIKNVPFAVTNEDLRTCMEQFGQVIYALVCVDPDTEHSKGTAFVKFQKKESAEECLSAGTELTLHDQVLDPHRAVNKEDLQRRPAHNNKHKDNRNLYLVKEGVVVAGSKAAAGVSMSDMSKRLHLEQSKSQLLRNLNMYVSPVRLVIHNLPPSWDDAKLRQLFSSHGGPNPVIREARVMRDFKNVDAEGIGKSKEYGFVTFTRHENALQALRNINNNPDVFTSAKRPIVSFSIENKSILNLKQKRLERSQARNPLCSEKHVKCENRTKMQEPHTPDIGEDKETFVGVTSKPGNVKMRSRFKLETQAKIHSQTVHKAKLKQNKKMQIAKEKIKQPKMKKVTKRKHDEDDGSFNTLVNKYKKKLMDAPVKKWYDSNM